MNGYEHVGYAKCNMPEDIKLWTSIVRKIPGVGEAGKEGSSDLIVSPGSNQIMDLSQGRGANKEIDLNTLSSELDPDRRCELSSQFSIGLSQKHSRCGLIRGNLHCHHNKHRNTMRVLRRKSAAEEYGRTLNHMGPSTPSLIQLCRFISSAYFLRIIFLIFLYLSLVSLSSSSRNFRKRQMEFDVRPKSGRQRYTTLPYTGAVAGLYPSLINLAQNADITANATCGKNGAEYFCKLVEHVPRISRRRKRSQCDTCSSTSPNPRHRHSIQFAIDGRGSTWWQSPSISNGYKNHWVTIQLDLKQVFQVAYVILKVANSPRPGNWILEKSLDGLDWKPWQYFAETDHYCRRLYPARTIRMGSTRYNYDSEVICTPYFSQILPLENGEIHISLINGRPTAENPSPELLDFTSARYIRFRFQKIRTLLADLMTIANQPEGAIDPSVTRRYFYSVKDISVGGMCICYGHAHDCPPNSQSKKFVCECKHNTVGYNCEQCAPKFNQFKWRPGTDGFQCEECNCFGHADSCHYDPDVDALQGSLDIRGIRRGGGVCDNCRDNTEGTNCDSCVDGYYRPIGKSPSDRYPCVPCTCNVFGSRTTDDGKYVCVKTSDDHATRLTPGDCFCKIGYAGRNCDRCDVGFRGFPNCEPCPCSAAGSINEDPCVGACSCKDHVQGQLCNQCKPGYFNLNSDNAAGCEECYCSGRGLTCSSATLYRDYIDSIVGWTIQDRPGIHNSPAKYDSDSGEIWVVHEDASQSVCTGLYYWAAPEPYLGNRLSSYGGTLYFTVYYKLDDFDSSPLQDVDIIIEGEDVSIEFAQGRELRPYENLSFAVPLAEGGGWLDSNSQLPASKNQILDAMKNVKRLLIRAAYNRNANSEFRIRSMRLETATRTGAGERVYTVEDCRCPAGYGGLSCEKCAVGYYRVGSSCVQCQCNGHSNTCNIYTGACDNCQANTVGIHCELCKPGFFGDATKGTPTDCKSCACPLKNPSNNFSPTCVIDQPGDVMNCLQCPVGYEGRQCQRCAQGYYGDPTEVGNSCKPCQCNDNAFTCNSRTGVCESCRGNTGGPHCEQCSPGYYGDALFDKYCEACNCDPDGSTQTQCHSTTGQCNCRPGVIGRRCNRCQNSEYLSRPRKACVPCDCDPLGSISSICDKYGQCSCKSGVTGLQCDRCGKGFFDFSSEGCRACDCEHTNQFCNPNTGACVCPPLSTGPGCSQCTPGAYGWTEDQGCKDCECNIVGSKSAQCDLSTGQCNCKPQYIGTRCDSCRNGFYNFPECRNCSCNLAGTELNSCEEKACRCRDNGQCLCKANVIGEKCDKCKEGSFSLQSDNPKGCTECFCFGLTDECYQAIYHWGDQISLRTNPEVMVSNKLNTRSTSAGLRVSRTKGLVTMNTSLVRKSLRYDPYYWRLPPQFNGDKLTSYGGRLRFTVYHVSDGNPFSSEPSIVIRGRHNATTISYQLEEPVSGDSRSYTVFMRENGWTHFDSRRPVTRFEFASVLASIEYFLIKASYGRIMYQSRLSDVFLDIATPGSGGRGDSTSSGSAALGVEECVCPPGYRGLSCQDCVPGYMRISTGQCKPCDCNGKSDICNVNTGKCVGCRDNFIGDKCDRCVAGYYLARSSDGPVCLKCACPLETIENNFSPTCTPVVSHIATGYVCDKCPTGYEGVHCERCSIGFYGNPTLPGGTCKKCGCNPRGSVSTYCDPATGKCQCKTGITGRVCDQCRPRHAITERGCVACDDECSGKLLEELEDLQTEIRNVDLENMFPPPWADLMKKKKNKTMLIAEELDTRMTSNMDLMRKIVSKMPAVRQLGKKVDHLFEKSKMCYLHGDDVEYRANRTQRRVQKQIEKAQKMQGEIDVFTGRIKRLLDRLRDGTTTNEASISEGMAQLMDKLRDRDMAQYQEIADRELGNAIDLKSKIRKMFVQQARNLTQVSEEFMRDIGLNVENAKRRIDDLVNKTLSANTTARQADKLNRMNKMLIKQFIAEFESIGNDLLKIGTALEELWGKVNDTQLTLYATREDLERQRLQANKFSNLIKNELEPETDKVIRGQSDLQAFRNLVSRAEHRMRELRDLARYFERIKNNITHISLNQTDAATRYSRIADVMARANVTAHAAFNLAGTVLEKANNFLERNARKELMETMELLDRLKEMSEILRGDKQRLQNAKKQIGSNNKLIGDLNKTYNGLKNKVNNLDLELKVPIDDIKNTSREALEISEEVLTKVDKLYDVGEKLKNMEEVAIKQSEIINEIKGNLTSVPTLLAESNAVIIRARESKMRVELKSDEVRNRIDDIRKQIEEARRKAASVRHAAVRSQGKCTMRYKPRITPGRVTEVIIQTVVETPNNTLFYLGREGGDYMLAETVNGELRVKWNLGSGTGYAEVPLNIISQPVTPGDYYRIRLYRRDQVMNITVHQTRDETKKISTSASSPGKSNVLNVDDHDLLYIGGLDQNVDVPVPILHRSFTGCMGEAYLQNKPIGMWNFREVSDPSHCTGCMASPMDMTTPPTVCSYDGNGYSLLQQMSRNLRRLTVIDFKFKTFASNALLMYRGASKNNDFASIELEDGKIIARMDMGNGINFWKTENRLNNGKWIQVSLVRHMGKVRLQTTVIANESLNEAIQTIVNGSDNHLNFSSTDLTCVGGCPPETVLAPIQKKKFIGCIKDMKIFRKLQPLTGSVVRYSQVEVGCPSEITRNIGIDVGGYVELPGSNIASFRTFSISFNTREPDALLLLTFSTGRESYYSLSIIGGYVEARLRVKSRSIELKSKMDIYSDGDEHVASVTLDAGKVHLNIDDGKDVVNGNFRIRSGQSPEMTSFFIGGVPDSINVKPMVATDVSLNGCVRELITERLINFNDAKSAKNSYFGSCVYTPTVVESYPSGTTTSKRSTTTVAPPSIPIVTIPAMVKPGVTREQHSGCYEDNDLTKIDSLVHFGRSSDSHMQFVLEEKIDIKFRFEIQFKTTAKNGLLLYAAHDVHSDFFSLQLKNGKPVFRFDSGKGAAEMAGNFSVNDGQWHTVRVSRSKRKGSIKVDGMRYGTIRSPPGANRMGVNNTLYVGGVNATLGKNNKRLMGIWQSPGCCVRKLTLYKRSFDLQKPTFSHNVEPCFNNTESGTYFDGTGYVIHNNATRVGTVMFIELEFRTWALDGILISISSPRVDGLALEIVNGTVVFRVNNGDGDVSTQYNPPPKMTLCDGQWHKISAKKSKSSVSMTVDYQTGTDPQITSATREVADTYDPLYLGGYPDDAIEQKQLTTNKKFKGCMRNVKLKGEMVDFSSVYEHYGIYQNSCPRRKA